MFLIIKNILLVFFFFWKLYVIIILFYFFVIFSKNTIYFILYDLTFDMIKGWIFFFSIIEFIFFLIIFNFSYLLIYLFLKYIYKFILIIYFIFLYYLLLKIFLYYLLNWNLELKPYGIGQLKIYWVCDISDAFKILLLFPKFWSFFIVNSLLYIFKIERTKLNLYELSKVIFVQIVLKFPYWLFLFFIDLLKFIIISIIKEKIFREKSFLIWPKIFFYFMKSFFIKKICDKVTTYWIFFESFEKNKKFFILKNRKFILYNN